MSAYENFLDFFTLHNKERLDGLSESYFTAMTPDERSKAFDYLLTRLSAGPTEETVHGLFMADEARAFSVIGGLLSSRALQGEAEIAAAWNLYRIDSDKELVKVFVKNFSNPNAELRGKAAYFVPSSYLTDELKAGLQGMIRTETDTLALIHAVTKLLECYGITRESVPKSEFSHFYRGLCSDEMEVKEQTFFELDRLVA